MKVSAGAWLRCYRPVVQPRLRVVCFPHAGGAASFYRSWGLRVPSVVEVIGVQYPGREDRLLEPCIDDMHRLADLVAEALAPIGEVPLALFGHSLGAAVAYEVARRLEQRGMSPLRLFVSGRPAPHRPRGTAVHLREDEVLWGELRRLGGTKSGVLEHPELRLLLLPILRSDYRLSETYRPRPGPPLACPVIAYLADCDTEVNLDEARAWRDVTAGDFRVRVFPGEHFYLVPRQGEVIGETLRCLGVESGARDCWPSTP